MAGRAQLAVSGRQEQFFTSNPDYTHFLEKFKRHSKFSRQYVDVETDNAFDFGSTTRFTIPQNQGDLLSSLSLKIKLPQILTSNVCYIESVGHGIIEHVDLLIGGEIVQRLTSDYLQIYSEHYVTQTKQHALEKLIGKYPRRTVDSKVCDPGIVAYNFLGRTDKGNVDLFVDLPFYFYRHPKLAVPLCAIKKQEVEVEVKLRKLQDIVITDTGNYHTMTDDIHIKDFQLCTEVVFLDPCERLMIESKSSDYLITQIQENNFNIDNDVNTLKVKLDFVNPVKELYFVIQRYGTTGDGTTSGNFVTPFDYDNTTDVVNGKYTLYENLDYLELTLDGEDIIKKSTGNVIFLKAIQSAIHHSKTQLLRRFYSYSFALQPEEWYPTGQVNMSHVKEQILNLSLTQCSTFSRQLRVYAESYNILRVSGGFAKTIFDTRH